MANYPSNFVKAAEKIISSEGGWLVSPTEGGGEAKYGITLHSWNNYAEMKNLLKLNTMKNITTDQAKAFYWFMLWEKNRVGSITSVGLQTALLDMLMGGPNRIKQLRTYLQHVFPAILSPTEMRGDKVDIVASITPWLVDMMNLAETKVPGIIQATISFMRAKHYTKLAIDNPQRNLKWLRGWLARATDQDHFVGADPAVYKLIAPGIKAITAKAAQISGEPVSRLLGKNPALLAEVTRA